MIIAKSIIGYNTVCSEVVFKCGIVSLIARIYKSRNCGVKMGVAPLTIIPSDPLARFLFPVPVTLCPVGLEVLVP